MSRLACTEMRSVDFTMCLQALMVMIYEGIVANVLDYDYAPQSECIENRRVYLNVSQVRGSSQAPHSVCLSLRYAHFVPVSRFFRKMRDAHACSTYQRPLSPSPMCASCVNQEGKSDVEFLREEELLNGLQVGAITLPIK